MDEVERLRHVWSTLNTHPETNIDIYSIVVRSRANVLQPHVVTLWNGGGPVAMMIARLETTTLDLKVGYFTLFRIPVRSLTILYDGLLGRVGDEETRLFHDHVTRMLRQGHADVAHYNGLRVGSDMFQTLTRRTRPFARDVVIQPEEHWAMDLPESKEKLLEELRVRHRNWMPNLRRWERTIQKEFGSGASIREFNRPEDMEELCRDAETIARKTYQRALGAGFQHNGEIYNRLCLEARDGNLRSLVFYLDGNPISFWIGSACRTTWFSYFLGFDPAFAKFRPGNIVFTRMIEHLCDGGIKRLDFGSGDALYKDRFGNTRWSEVSIYQFAAQTRLLLISMLRTLLMSLDLLGRFLLRSAKSIQSLKTYWRKRLAKPAQEDARP